jgi:hypothetical protein
MRERSTQLTLRNLHVRQQLLRLAADDVRRLLAAGRGPGLDAAEVPGPLCGAEAAAAAEAVGS